MSTNSNDLFEGLTCTQCLCLVSVDDSAILDCQFSDFYHTAPQGFEKILFEQQIF